MDLNKVGNFIAGLRKECGITREMLGEKIGVTGKTVSRWETGKYMPPADMLLAMSEIFDVSVNEFLSGKRLTTQQYRETAENTVRESDAFSLKEKIDFCKKKWLKEHISVMAFAAVIIICIFGFAIILKSLFMGYATIIIIIFAHMKRNNEMMTYVERNAFDGSGSK